MKKFFALMIILSCSFAFNGCNVDDQNDDDILDDNDIPGGLTADDNDYLTSVRTADERLRSAIKDEKDYDINDADYLTNEKDYYTSRAQAYRSALNDVKDLQYNTDNKLYHQAVVDYYQRGYDMYNDLGDRYSTFTTTADETAYRTGLGIDAYDIQGDVTTAYEDALRAMGITVGTGTGTGTGTTNGTGTGTGTNGTGSTGTGTNGNGSTTGNQ